MTQRGRNRVLGAAAIGSALAGAYLLAPAEYTAPLRNWDAEDRGSLAQVARIAIAKSPPHKVKPEQVHPALAGLLHPPVDPQDAAPSPVASARATARATTSDRAIATSLAEAVRVLEPVSILPEELRAAALPVVPQEQVALASPAPALAPPPGLPALAVPVAVPEQVPEPVTVAAPAPVSASVPSLPAPPTALAAAPVAAPIFVQPAGVDMPPPSPTQDALIDSPQDELTIEQLFDIAWAPLVPGEAAPPAADAASDAPAALAPLPDAPPVAAAEEVEPVAALAAPPAPQMPAPAPAATAAPELVPLDLAALPPAPQEDRQVAPRTAAPVQPPATSLSSTVEPPPTVTTIASLTQGGGGGAAAVAASQIQAIDMSPGRQTFPVDIDAPPFGYDDELILQIRVAGVTATDTIVAYGTRAGVYLPLGELARILDLAIRVSDDGNYASGWFLSEDRTLVIDLRQQRIVTPDGERPLPRGMAQAFDGEMYLRADAFAALLPLRVEPDLRAQAVRITTLEPFPFEERMRREQDRARLAGQGNAPRESWPREETPWLALSVPMADIETRAVSDSTKGERLEGDVRLAGDLAFLTAQAFVSATTRDGLVASVVELGRRDADGDLLGPLGATEFSMGDVGTGAMPMGLRGTSGRGLYLTNEPLESVSVFDRVDLRGVLPDGYEVELYRNDILLGSTAQAVNGQYEFLEIPVDYGLNVFRLVFYGPQGQRREEVRRITVGDGRLSPGEFRYTVSGAQRGVNLLGVRGPDWNPPDRYGDWQAVTELSYGLSSALTAVTSAAFFQDGLDNRWIATAGLRTGIGPVAVRADAGASDGSGMAMGLGLGGRALGGSFTLNHFEYGGGFVDELRSLDSSPMRRATDFDYNTSLYLGGARGTTLPLTARIRQVEFADGSTRLNAGLRSSSRFDGLLVSGVVEYLRSTVPGGIGFSQLMGSFDLATFNRSATQVRASLGYSLLPQVELSQVSLEAVHRVDDSTVVNAGASYAFSTKDTSLQLSTVREFDRFTLALDGSYSLRQNVHMVALRLAFSLGRDPMTRRMFITQPGLAGSGAVALRAFHDRDGDGLYGEGDLALPEVDFAVFNNTATTDADGHARLAELGNGNRVSVQVDTSSLPDIAMVPVTRGIEIMPRAGRFHMSEFAIVEVSELEGTVRFAGSQGGRGVSGLRLQLRAVGSDPAAEASHTARSERGGYYLFEQVRPGIYDIVIDPVQASQLGVCLADSEPLVVGAASDVLERDLTVVSCGT